MPFWKAAARLCGWCGDRCYDAAEWCRDRARRAWRMRGR